MGVCVACFIRDIAGGLGLHRASVVQYLRPEIMGFMLGALISAFAKLGLASQTRAIFIARLLLVVHKKSQSVSLSAQSVGLQVQGISAATRPPFEHAHFQESRQAYNPRVYILLEGARRGDSR